MPLASKAKRLASGEVSDKLSALQALPTGIPPEKTGQVAIF
jgi:hypothetical protein